MITYFFTMKSKRFLKINIYFNDSGESRMGKMVKVKQRIEDFASGHELKLQEILGCHREDSGYVFRVWIHKRLFIQQLFCYGKFCWFEKAVFDCFDCFSYNRVCYFSFQKTNYQKKLLNLI